MQSLGPFLTDDGLGKTLMRGRINDLIKRFPDCCVAEFIDAEKNVTTKARVTREEDDLTWKEFTTILDRPHTMFVLNYKLPYRQPVQHAKFYFELTWRILHVGDTIDQVFRGEGLVDLELESRYFRHQ